MFQELVFRFVFARMMPVFAEWCQFSPEAKSAKLQKYMLQAVDQIFCSQHRSLAGWGKKQRTVPVEKIIIDVDALFVQWRFSLGPEADSLQAKISARMKV